MKHEWTEEGRKRFSDGRRATAIKGFVERFWSMVAKLDDGCWVWVGYTVHRYGVVYRPGGRKSGEHAHRVAWELTHGPIPAGMDVCHHCDNPPCCNPAHLFTGTAADNMRDKEAKGRGNHPRGPKMSEAARRREAAKRLSR